MAKGLALAVPTSLSACVVFLWVRAAGTMSTKSGRMCFAFAAVVIAAVGLGIGSGAQAGEPDRSTRSGTFTTTLYPGWNMVGWTGSNTATSTLFEAVPSLRQASSWDSERAAYRRAWRDDVSDLPTLKRGMGLWLLLESDRQVEWTREELDEHVLVDLSAGRHLVGWDGTEGTAMAEVLADLGDAVVGASIWDAKLQEFRHFSGAMDGVAAERPDLNRGDALWLYLAEDTYWWLRGSAGPELVFIGELSEERRAEIRRVVAQVMSFYAHRYGIVVPEYSLYISPDPDSAAARARELTGRGSLFEDNLEGGTVTDTAAAGLLGFIAGSFVTRDDDQFKFVLAHEYYHLIQHFILRSAGASAATPAWLIEGTAQYGEDLYGKHAGDFDPHVSRLSSSLREQLSFENIIPYFDVSHYSLAALAVDWLVERSGSSEAHVDYWRALARIGMAGCLPVCFSYRRRGVLSWVRRPSSRTRRHHLAHPRRSG